MEDRIKNVMAAVFEIHVDDITDATSPDTVQLWDSLKHMQLVIALEEEFGIRIEDEEIVEMLNYSLIKNIISEKV